jgi:hypothetical protein
VEKELTHLILRGSDPFELFFTSSKSSHRGLSYLPQSASNLNIQAPEIARTWSYDLGRESELELLSKEWIDDFETAEETKTPQLTFRWSPSGLVYGQLTCKYRKHRQDPEVARTHYISTRHPGEDQFCQISINATKKTPDDDGGYSTHTEDEHTDILSNSDILEVEEGRAFYKGQTQLYHHISIPSGRRKLSRVPMALALCSALQFAGYRAEMNDDGDIWYEGEDGDRYFDARENQPEEDEDDDEDDNDLYADLCPICRDFESHGLGHI